MQFISVEGRTESVLHTDQRVGVDIGLFQLFLLVLET